jgi:hypothetical protein
VSAGATFTIGEECDIVVDDVATAATSTTETCECVRKSFRGERGDLGRAGGIQEFLDFLLADTDAVQARLEAFHGESEQHQQDREQNHSECLHTEE